MIAGRPSSRRDPPGPRKTIENPEKDRTPGKHIGKDMKTMENQSLVSQLKQKSKRTKKLL